MAMTNTSGERGSPWALVKVVTMLDWGGEVGTPSRKILEEEMHNKAAIESRNLLGKALRWGRPGMQSHLTESKILQMSSLKRKDEVL